MTTQKKAKVKVPFTRWQYQRVQQFLHYMNTSKIVENDLGGPLKVTVVWVPEEGSSDVPHVHFLSLTSGLEKKIPLKGILEADDNVDESTLPAPQVKQ
jgi:hypothetical protein